MAEEQFTMEEVRLMEKLRACKNSLNIITKMVAKRKVNEFLNLRSDIPEKVKEAVIALKDYIVGYN